MRICWRKFHNIYFGKKDNVLTMMFQKVGRGNRYNWVSAGYDVGMRVLFDMPCDAGMTSPRRQPAG